jgi:hypothetical protein
MAITKIQDGTAGPLTPGAAETTLHDTGAVLGCYVLEVDLSQLANGEEAEIVLYNKTLTGDTYIEIFRESYRHVQDVKVAQSLPVNALYGVKAAIRQYGGTGRSFKWSLHRIDT